MIGAVESSNFGMSGLAELVVERIAHNIGGIRKCLFFLRHPRLRFPPKVADLVPKLFVLPEFIGREVRVPVAPMGPRTLVRGNGDH